MENVKKGLSGWLPVVGLTLSVFVFNTSEFIPIGLLTDIANDFRVSEAQAGMLISFYAWAVALLSLPLMIACSHVEYRKLILWLVGLFTLSHVLSALSFSYTTLLLSRLCVACCHSVFWAIVAPMAVKVAPEGKSAAALSLIITGSSVAMIVGLPIGRIIGVHMGWRLAFGSVAFVSFIVLMVLMSVFPKLPNDSDFSIRDLPKLLGNKGLIWIYVLCTLMVTGNYTCYSYIEPFLSRIARMDDVGITITLTMFGLAGMVGSFIFSNRFNRWQHKMTAFVITGMCLSYLMIKIVAPTWGIMGVIIFWGIVITIYNLILQEEVIRVEPKATTIAMAIYSGIYNVGIASGAAIGGLVCSTLDVAFVGYIGGAIAAVGVALGLTKVIPTLKKM